MFFKAFLVRPSVPGGPAGPAGLFDPFKGLIRNSLLNSPFKKGSKGIFRVNSKNLTSKCWFSRGLISKILV